MESSTMWRHGLGLSALVALSTIGACAPAAPKAAGGDGLPTLVKSSIRSDVSLHAHAQGRLHLDPGGCLRIDEDGPFIIWSHDSRVSRTGDGRVQVIDGASGNAVLVGEVFAVTGAGVDAAPSQLTAPVPPACATGKFWLAGAVMDEVDRLAMLSRQKRMGAGGGLAPPPRP